MSGPPRLLAILGSGETSPGMARVHRQVLGRLGPPPVPAVMLDTPAAFQENVGLLGARVAEYFRLRLQQPITPLAIGGDVARPGPAGAVALGQLAAARYVFAGPGSPSYALRQWRGTAVPELLADKLTRGGCVTFASAAALTLGVVTLPVYEMYKVGAAPHWLPGLDLLALAGLRAAVVPHFNNTDGGDHDTRCCYVGERRLAALEAQLPPGAFVLGVDEHTAVVFDLDAATATIAGRGALTVRVRGAGTVFAPGTTVSVADLAAAAARLGAAPAAPVTAAMSVNAPDTAPPTAPPAADLADTAARAAADFDRRLAEHDLAGAVEVALALEAILAGLRGAAAAPGEAVARVRLRGMVARLGELATAGPADRRGLVTPVVEAVLAARRSARADGQWALADALRDVLAAAGVEVRDTPGGSEWSWPDAA